MNSTRRGFTLVETVVSVIGVAALLAVLMPMASRSRNADGLSVSMMNAAAIVQSSRMYYEDHASRVPMRGSRYTNGMLSGWENWNYGGKNCDIFWATGVFDQSAYSRFLNAYVPMQRIPKPANYVNTGSGSTWTFNSGTPTPVERLSLEAPLFKSPGDVATRQRSWPNPTPGVSLYNDVGTSYLVNMIWWGAPGMPTGSFTAMYNGGVNLVNTAFGGATPNFVWVTDQTADIVANSQAGFAMMGEFGKVNASVVGYADGRAAYLQITAGATSGPGYTFVP